MNFRYKINIDHQTGKRSKYVGWRPDNNLFKITQKQKGAVYYRRVEKSGSRRWFNLLVSRSLMEYHGEQSSSEIIGYISEFLVMKADLAAVTSFLYIKRKHKSGRCHLELRSQK